MPATLPTSPPADHRIEARLRAADRIARDQHVETVRAYQAKSVEAAVALAAILDNRLYVEAGTFPEFALKEFGIRRRRAYQLAAAGRVYVGLRDVGADPLPKSEAQLRPLAELDGLDDRRAAWELALGRAGGDASRVTMEDVEYAVNVTAGRHGTSAAPISEGVVLAAVERMLDVGAPTETLQGEHGGLLGLLHPEDQANVWIQTKADSDAAGTAKYDGDGWLEKVPLGVVKKAVRGLAATLPVDAVDRGPADPDGLAVLLEGLLVGDVPAGTPAIGGSYLVPYAGFGELVDALVAALDRDGGIPPGADRAHKETVSARRRMVRCRLEPDVAAWTWAVLAPAARRTATTWLPDPDAPAPCYVPARLTQPTNTHPKTLDLRTPTGRTVLLAPGVDLLRGDVPDEITMTVLTRAGAAEHLAFLVATNHPDRIADHAWPPNVVPAVAAHGSGEGDPAEDEALPDVADAVARALAGFEAAGVRGALVLDGCSDPLPDDLLGRVRDHARVVLLRGSATGQRLYDQVLSLRPAGVLMVATADVRCRPWDALIGSLAELPARATAAVSTRLPRPTA